MTAADGTRLDPRLTALFDAGASWATEPTDRRGYGDALRDAVERAGTPGDRDRGRELTEARNQVLGVLTVMRLARLSVEEQSRAILDLEAVARSLHRALAAPQSGITREAVIEAVDRESDARPPQGAVVADRLGLTEKAGQAQGHSLDPYGTGDGSYPEPNGGEPS